MKNSAALFHHPACALVLTSLAALACGAGPDAAGASEPAVISRYIAIDNVCAWPNLTQLRDGTIIATIHNAPDHGTSAGDVSCWASTDGEFWEKRGHPAPNDPDTVRMNVAAGLARNGDLLVLCSGWTNVRQPELPKRAPFRDAVLRLWVCRSQDGGRTWTQHREFAEPAAGYTEYVPFGPISVGADGALHVSCYAGELRDPKKSETAYRNRGHRSWHFRSNDDGLNWHPVSVISPRHNETTLFHLGEDRWIAAARDQAVDLFRSEDNGRTWAGPHQVTGVREYNAHLLRLGDGRLLLSYGNRVEGHRGVLARLSGEEGRTWGPPIRLIHTGGDNGYPSSVQRADGRIVTAYYAKAVENHDRYHMGVIIWEVPEGLR
jgi:hypothetical protein